MPNIESAFVVVCEVAALQAIGRHVPVHMAVLQIAASAALSAFATARLLRTRALRVRPRRGLFGGPAMRARATRSPRGLRPDADTPCGLPVPGERPSLWLGAARKALRRHPFARSFWTTNNTSTAPSTEAIQPAPSPG